MTITTKVRNHSLLLFEVGILLIMSYNDIMITGKYDEKEEAGTSVHHKKNNVLPLWGNDRSMNLNPLILTNIQSSHYFKGIVIIFIFNERMIIHELRSFYVIISVNLYELKTYHEVIDEIYYKVNHLEPWEKGSRKTAGQTGMCGGVC